MATNYIDPQTIDGFRILITEQLVEAIEFTLNRLAREGSVDQESRRQAAQDALAEISGPFVDCFIGAYKRSPMRAPDYEAIASLFKDFALKARVIEAIEKGAKITIATRRGSHTGVPIGLIGPTVETDGEESVSVDGELIPLVAILDIEESEITP